MNSTSFPKVFVIVLNYNAGRTLHDCLLSIFGQTYQNFEVVLVDNFSTDGSFEAARNNFSRCHFIRSDKNIGFAAGNNLGIRFALEKMADFIFLLNPDAIIEKEGLAKLIATVKNIPSAGIFSPLIFKDRSEQVWFSGGKIEWLKMKAVHFSKTPSLDSPYPTQYVSGCAMLIRKEVFREAGLFDEDFFLYYEDTDLSLRSCRKNFKLFVDPRVHVYHFETSKNNLLDKTYWLVFSGIIFFQKNCPFWIRPWMNFYLRGRQIKNWLDLKTHPTPLAKTVKNAYNDYAQWKKNQSKYR